jgi:hypothetical protein
MIRGSPAHRLTGSKMKTIALEKRFPDRTAPREAAV